MPDYYEALILINDDDPDWETRGVIYGRLRLSDSLLKESSDSLNLAISTELSHLLQDMSQIALRPGFNLVPSSTRVMDWSDDTPVDLICVTETILRGLSNAA